MEKNNNARWLLRNRPKENQYTAAWADIKRVKPGSQVTIPDDYQVIEAKEWVEINKK